MTDTTPEIFSALRPCSRCKGEGNIHSAWAVEHNHEGPEGKVCPFCKGKGTFEGLNVEAIVNAIFTKRGKAFRFRKSFPSKLNHYGTVFGARAYYVWRLARFHGGADVTMPVVAMTLNEYDPFKVELDVLADYVSKKVFKTDMSGAFRWGAVLGFCNPSDVPRNLPESAYEGGQVVLDGSKPLWEALELK